MNKKLLSIIVPVYNAGSYLEYLIESILSQSFDNIELLLINDGSIDNSGQVCYEAAKKDKRVKVISQENRGQSAARNVGLEIAQGDYIAFADHDDLIHPCMYEWMIHEMEKSNAKVCACDFLNVEQSLIDYIKYDTMKKYDVITYSEKELLHDYFKPNWRIPIWNKIYAKDIVKDMRFSNFHLGEDNLFSYKVIKRSDSIIFINKPLYFQRMHGNNFEFTGIKYYTELLKVKENILHDIKRCYRQEYKNAQKLFLYECIRIYNQYVEMGVHVFQNEIEQTLAIFKRNIINIVISDLPIGHKILFMKIKYCRKNELNKKILI